MKFKKVLLIATCSLSTLTFSCSRIQSKSKCINNDKIEKSLEMPIKMLDGNFSEEKDKITELKLIENTCYKKVFEKNGHHLILFKNPSSPSDSYNISLVSIKNKPTRKCFNNALNAIEQMNASFANSIISQEKITQSWKWNDLDIGPAKWLNCNDEKSSDFYESIATLLHETIHGLRNDNCLFYPHENNKICFDLSDKLPLRSLAKLDNFYTTDKKIIDAIQAVQAYYLTNSDQPPLLLFDELNAYIVTTKTDIQLISHRNPFNFEILPLMALYSIRYVNELKKKDLALFKSNFEDNKHNWESLIKLFNEAEKTFETYVKTMKSNKIRQHEYEIVLFNKYKEIRKELKIF